MQATGRWLQEQNVDAASLLALESEKSWLLGLAERLGHLGHWWVRLPDYAIRWSDEVYEIHGGIMAWSPVRLVCDIMPAPRL